MTLAVAASNTTTATGTEATLTTLTAGKTYVFKIDTTNMQNGDLLVLRIKEKVLSGGASSLERTQIYQHAQGEPVKLSEPIPANVELVVTMQQPNGTGRSFPWSVLSLD